VRHARLIGDGPATIPRRSRDDPEAIHRDERVPDVRRVVESSSRRVVESSCRRVVESSCRRVVVSPSVVAVSEHG